MSLSSLFGCPRSNPRDNPSPSLDLSDSEDVFTFESDHMALRGNADYLALVRTLCVLEAQRSQAVKDIERLNKAKEEALKDPLGMVERLQRGETLSVPAGRQKIAEMPKIDWEKYRVDVDSVPASASTARNLVALAAAKKHGTRNKARAAAAAAAASEDEPSNKAKVEINESGQFLVRGRPFSDSKPVTFNQPWTPEEQQRLEQLLMEFPSEEVEMERWKKIAKALGNRTAVQVQSRTQKYFIKLQKAGLPIPGKAKSKYSRNVSSSSSGSIGKSVSAKNSLVGQKRSTFFPSLQPSVKMEEDDDDDDDDPAAASVLQDGLNTSAPINNDAYFLEDDDVSEEEDIPEAMRDTDGYREMIWLKRIRREMEFEHSLGEAVVHVGFRCDSCGVEPIRGGRFQCVDRECIEGEDTVDLCCECAPKGLSLGRHRPSHAMRPARKKRMRPLIDRDYQTTKNYLDTNFAK